MKYTYSLVWNSKAESSAENQEYLHSIHGESTDRVDTQLIKKLGVGCVFSNFHKRCEEVFDLVSFRTVEKREEE
jgi:hypothetical protein